jgi:hypothetical protein
MSTPNITVVIEPAKGDHVVFEPVAGKDANAPAVGLLDLVLTITNHADPAHGDPPIHLTKVTVAFPGTAVPTAKIDVPPDWWPPGGAGVHIASGGSFVWNFLRENGRDDTIRLPMPAPTSLKLGLHFEGFSEPWTTTMPLAQHRSPVDGGGYQFPAHFDDLTADEYWIGTSQTHGTGGAGTQLFAYDMVVQGWDSDINELSELHPGTDGTKNKHWRVWGKKLYAMADGLVLQAIGDIPNNPIPIDGNLTGNKAHDDQLQADQDALWSAYDDSHGGGDKVCAGCGNHFFIQYGDEVALYAHMQHGSLNPALVNPPAGTPLPVKVKKGDFLGLAGNSGNASRPHLHIHVTKALIDPPAPLESIAACAGGPPRPLLWRDAFVIDSADLEFPDLSGPWQRLKNQGPPLGEAWPNTPLIWPLGRNPMWNGWEDLGASITSAPAVTAWSPDRLDLFAGRNDGQLAHRTWNGTHWSQWESLGGSFKGGPAAVSRDFERIDVFVRGTDDHIGHRWWDGSSWQGWKDLGGGFTSAPAVASRGPNSLDLFAAGSDGKLQHRTWNGSTWSNWGALGGTCKGAPTAVSWGANRIDVFVRGQDDHLWQAVWDGQWHQWEDLGGKLGSAPAVSSWGTDRLDIFAADADGQMMHKSFNGSKWSGWDGIGGSFKDHPAAVSWGPKRIDVFVCGDDAHIGHLWRG